MTIHSQPAGLLHGTVASKWLSLYLMDQKQTDFSLGKEALVPLPYVAPCRSYGLF